MLTCSKMQSIFIIIYISQALATTFFRIDSWPFTDYNMFSKTFSSTEKLGVFRLAYITDNDDIKSFYNPQIIDSSTFHKKAKVYYTNEKLDSLKGEMRRVIRRFKKVRGGEKVKKFVLVLRTATLKNDTLKIHNKIVLSLDDF